MWAGIAAGLQLMLLVLKWFYELNTEQKKKVAEKLKEISNAADSTSSITRMFDDISRM